MPKFNETPEFVGVADANLLSLPSVPVAVNVALKLPVFWPEAAEYSLRKLMHNLPSNPSQYPRPSPTMR